MSSFTGEITVTELGINWRLWRLESDLTYEIDSKGSGKTITPPKGFITDFASIPRILWIFLPPWGKYSRAAIIHDYLCILLYYNKPNQFAINRAKADRIFLEAMEVSGVTTITRYILYLGVRIGGELGKIFNRSNVIDKYNKELING